MRLRSGLRVGSEVDEAGGSNMSDIHSTQADWGTPQNSSSSFSNSASNSQQQRSASPHFSPHGAGASGFVPPQQAGQHHYQPSVHPHADFILYAADPEQYADTPAPLEQIPGQPHLPANSAYLPPQQPPQASFSSYPAPQQFSPHNGYAPSHPHNHGNSFSNPPPHNLQTIGLEPVIEDDPIQQWPDPPPWSPVGAETNIGSSLAGMTEYPPDRNHPDKMQEDLDKIGSAQEAVSDEDEEKQKRKQLKRRKGRRVHRNRPKRRESDRDRKDRGGRGGSSSSHGIRAG